MLEAPERVLHASPVALLTAPKGGDSMKRHCWLLCLVMLGLPGCSHSQTRAQAADEVDRDELLIKGYPVIGDVSQVNNLRPTPVSGVGLVGGLDGTGGGAPPGEFRKMLEDNLRAKGVQNIQQVLGSNNYAMVLVSAVIPPGSRKGDPLDIEVQLPAQSKAVSLRGGSLYACDLFNYENMHLAQGGERLLKGHVLAKAEGPLLVGFGDGDEDVKLRRGRIWQGGVSLIDAPFYLVLQNDQKSAIVANAVATRINAAFPDDARKQALVRQNRQYLVLGEITNGINSKFPTSNGLGRGDAAHAVGKDVVYVNVPVEYRVNPARYVHVVLCIPLHDTGDMAGKYRKRLNEMLLEPKDTIRAALRLEALGKESVPALRRGLTSNEPLVRFAAAEALTYLGTTEGMDELGRLAEQYETLRSQCLMAMASLNESRCQAKLTELMRSTKSDVRIGAFRALQVANETTAGRASSPELRGDLIGESFWLHRVAPLSQSMVHVSLSRRAEIVVFGEPPTLVPPFQLSVGEFLIQATAGDERCTVNRFVVSAKGGPRYKQCGFGVDEVLRKIAEMGGQYPDAVEFLRLAERSKCVSCAVLFDALPTAPENVFEVLAACGSDPIRFKESPEFMQQLQTAQQDLGMNPGRGLKR
jgi:hypothetical protein